MKTFIVIFSIFFLISCSGFPVSKDTSASPYVEQLEYLQKQTIDLQLLAKILITQEMIPKWKEGVIDLKANIILTSIENLHKALEKAGGEPDRCYIAEGTQIIKCKKELKILYRTWETATKEIFPCLAGIRIVKHSRK